jgi:hypothetical protein
MARKRQLRRKRTSSASRQGGAASSSGDFNPDYSYVIQDLRRIGLLTGFFLIIMVILTFILR